MSEDFTLVSEPTLDDKIKRSIELLRENEPSGGYGLAFSGGKDSCVIKQLAIEAGVKFKAYYSVTTLDPPELVRFIRQYHSEIEWLRQPKPMLWEMSEHKLMPPNRYARWCCGMYKEAALKEYPAKLIGVRASESIRRARLWREVVIDRKCKKRKYVCPIVDWTDNDVWTFIKDRKLPYCCLYEEGFKRLGCIGCPLSGTKNMRRDFERWKGFENTFRKAFHKMWENVQIRQVSKNGRPLYGLKFKNGDEWFEDYIEKCGLIPIEENCQMELMFTGIDEQLTDEENKQE